MSAGKYQHPATWPVLEINLMSLFEQTLLARLSDDFPYISMVEVQPYDECSVVSILNEVPGLRLLGITTKPDTLLLICVACATPEARTEFERRAM
jgi:hypothetical protein